MPGSWGGRAAGEGTEAGVGVGLKGWAAWVGRLTGGPAGIYPRCSPCTAVYKFQARPWPPPRFSLPGPSVAQPRSQELRGASLGPRASLPSPVSSWDSLAPPCPPPPVSALFISPSPDSQPAQTRGSSLLTRVHPCRPGAQAQPPPAEPGAQAQSPRGFSALTAAHSLFGT